MCSGRVAGAAVDKQSARMLQGSTDVGFCCHQVGVGMQQSDISDGWFFDGNRGPCRVPRTPHGFCGYNDLISQDRGETWTWAAWKAGQLNNLIECALPTLQLEVGTACPGARKSSATLARKSHRATSRSSSLTRPRSSRKTSLCSTCTFWSPGFARS